MRECSVLLGVVVIILGTLFLGVQSTAIVTNYVLACKDAQGCEGTTLALTASSLSNDATITLQAVREGDELLATQDWTVDPVSNRISLTDYPNLVLAKHSLSDTKVVLRDLKQNQNGLLFVLSQWTVSTDNHGFWTFRQQTLSSAYMTVYGGSDGLRVEAQLPGWPGSTQFLSFEPIPVFDYVIVGAGTGGCKLSKLLSDGGFASVAVLEAGIRRDDDPLVQSPRAVRSVESSPIYNFPYFTDIIPNLGGQRFTVGVGKMWGGTSNHNGMLYDRGLQYDWNSYVKYGGEAWSYNSVQSIYTAQENYTGVQPGFGKNGELSVVDSTTFPAPAADVFINATQPVWPSFVRVPSLNTNLSGAVTTFQLTQLNLGNGTYIRDGSSRAFLNASVVDPQTGKGVNGRKLQIFSRSFGSKLIFHRSIPNKVVGVEYITGDQCKKILARKEVILSAGAFNSPSLLMRSGVGNCTYLNSLNISCTFNNPYVGQNLQDHFRVQMAVGLPEYMTQYIAATELPLDVDGHLMEGRILTDLASAYTDYSVTNQTQPDTKFSTVYTLQSPMANIPILFDLNWVNGITPIKAPIIEFAGILLRPKCMGHVQIVSPLPLEVPQINHNYLCDPDDVAWANQTFHNFIKIVNNLKKLDPVYEAKFPTEEMVLNATTFARLLPVLANGYRHPVGSCRMGKFNSVDRAVVSPRLCVHGLSGVRVADASVFPIIPSNNPQSAVYVVAGLAARFIQQGPACE